MRQPTCRYWGALILLCMMALSAAIARPLELGIDYSDLTPAALKRAMSPNLKGYRIGIALSGGGARGFAHVGVLDELEKSGIEIDAVAGTSMGGIVGGLYASGMTPEEIQEAALQIRWNDFFSDKPQRGSQLFTRRAEVEGELLTLRFDGLNPRIPTALSSGQKLVNVLSSLTLTSGYFSSGDFANLERKLAVVATDIVTGEKVVFEGGSLIDALRATMSVPLAFTPVESKGQLLMDGGLVEPVPTQTLKEIGADFVIAVDVTSDLMPAKEISDPIDIAGQVTTILSSESKNRLLSDADFVITPDLRGIKATAFEQGDSTIERGRRATSPRILELKRKLAQVTDTSATVRVDEVVFVDSSHGEPRSQDNRAVTNLMELRGQTVRGVRINQVLLDLFRSGVYAGIGSRWDGRTLCVAATPLANIATVNFNGNQLYVDSVLLRESGAIGTSITSLTQLQKLYASILSFYRRNGYDLVQIKGAWLDTTKHELEIVLDEGRISGISVEGNDKTRWWVVNSYFPLRPGDFYSKFRAMSGVQYVYASGLFDNVNLRLEERNGGVWITIVVKERPFTFARLSARYHEDAHPECLVKSGYANLSGTGNEISMAARFSERRKLYQLQMRADRIFRSFVAYDIRLYYANDKVGIYRDNRRILERTDKRWGVKLGVGQQLWKRGLLDVTARFEGVKYRFSNDTLGTERRVASLQSNLMMDTRDRFTFPTSGRAMRLSAEVASDVLSADEVFKKFEGVAETHLRLSRYANIHPRLAIGLSEDDMPVYEKFRLGGSRNFFGYAVDQLVGDKYFLGNFEVRFGPLYSAYMSFRYDAGQVFGRFEEVRFQGLRHSYGAALAVDTPVGPLSISYGRAEAKYDRIYLNLGYDF